MLVSNQTWCSNTYIALVINIQNWKDLEDVTIDRKGIFLWYEEHGRRERKGGRKERDANKNQEEVVITQEKRKEE